MVWRTAATVILDTNGRYLDADEQALDLLGVDSVATLRETPPERFAALPPDPAEQEAWREAYFRSASQGVLAEGAYRRLDGELVRVRTAIVSEPDGTYRALFYPIERPTTNLTARTYTIAQVLGEWRAAERRLVSVEPQSEEGRRLEEEIEVLRAQYQAMFNRSLGSRS